jgi:hypothetical protein
VITGFNTDVEYEGVTYHIQTEDKGMETPLILSLVYNRGTILASKRSPYDDLLISELDEKVLAARLQKQHKLICAAVRTGRIEDLKRMTIKDSAAKKKESAAQNGFQNGILNHISPEIKPQSIAENLPYGKVEIKTPLTETKNSIVEKQKNTKEIAAIIDAAKEKAVNQSVENVSTQLKAPTEIETTKFNYSQPSVAENHLPSIPKPKRELEWELSTKSVEKEFIIEAVQIIEDEIILPAEAVEIVTEFPKTDSAKAGKLKIELLAEPALKGGDRKTISVLICRGSRENGVGGAEIMVKVLGSSFRPLIFHAKSDASGAASVHLQLPHFRQGRAALLIRAMNDGEQVELRRAILHG